VPPKKRIRQAAPTSGLALSHTGDLGDALAALTRAASGGRRPTGVRRTRSLNSSKVGVNKALQVTPTTRPTEVGTGESPRSPGIQAPQLGSLPGLPSYEQIELDLGIEPTPAEAAEDRTEVLSPPNSIEPGRPRAREARYNPDSRQLVVRFRHGGTYTYYGVPTSTWRALKRNKSFGQTLDRLVLNQYPYEKVAF
jgi:hypothetical protein